MLKDSTSRGRGGFRMVLRMDASQRDRIAVTPNPVDVMIHSKRWIAAATFATCAVVGLHAQTATRSTPEQPADDSETKTLNAFTVSSDRDHGYIATNSVGATRSNVAIADTPQAITVFNDLFIEDTLSFNLTELANYNPSFEPTIADKGTYFSRGFTAKATFVDGMAQRNTFGPNYTANVDRVEFLQGPTAIFYGDGPGGAAVNRVLKRAIPRRFTNVTLSAGDYDFQRGSLDTGGPLGLRIAGRQLSYRFNAALQDANGWKLWSKDREQLYSPAFSIPLGPKTDLFLNFTYDRTNITGTFAEPVTNGVPGLIVLPNGTQLHMPERNSMDETFDDRPLTKTLTSYDFTHTFNSHLSFRSQYQFETYEQRLSEAFAQIGQYVYTATTASIRRIYRAQNVDYKADRLREELLGNFATGPLQHKVLAGFSFDETNETDFYRQTGTAALPTIDLINPVYGTVQKPDISTVPVTTNQQIKNVIRAFYANDLVALFNERLFLQAGYRNQDYYQRNNNRLRNTNTGVTINATTTSFGMVYHLTPDKTTSLWASLSSSFEPNFQVNPDGSTLPPTTGKTYEEGIKLNILQNTLNVDFSVFHTLADKVPMAAPSLGDGFQVAGPGQTAQGFQLNARYSPSRRLQVYGGYSYLDAYTTATKQTLTNAPKDSFSGFIRYEQIGGRLDGLFGTVGYIYRGTRDPQIAATGQFWQIPTLNRLDLGLGYRWKMGNARYQVSFNVKNANDGRNFADNNQTDRYVLLPPRSFLLTLRAQY